MLRGIASIVLLLGLAGGIFYRHAMQECHNLPPITSQKGKIVLVTGGNSGLGLETTRVLAAAGATVIIGCRSPSRGSVAREGILVQHPEADVSVMELDLSSFGSIRSFASKFEEAYGRLDILVNNAGIMAVPTRELTQDGIESQIGTNHVGHFMLTSLLYPLLSKNARVINHSSEAHHLAPDTFPFSDIQSAKNYAAWTAYGLSKAANLLFTYELNNRLHAIGNPKNITSIAVHPGYTSTNLQAGRFPFADLSNSLFAMDVKDGALAQIYAAAGADVSKSDNNYYGPKYKLFGAPAETPTDKRTWDRDGQVALWEESLRLIGRGSCFISV